MKPGHQLVLLVGGDELFPALIEAMDAARQVVHLETYIFEFAGSALQVAEALERAARRGVEVRLVVDGVGTPRVPPEWRQRFDEAGVKWRVYSPLDWLGLLLPGRWRRLHRKLCVVDQTVGFCGGVNIIDDRDDVALGRLDEPRLDFSLRVAGPLVLDMVATMDQLWTRLEARHSARKRPLAAAWQALRSSGGGGAGDFSRLLRKLEGRARGRAGGEAEEGSSLLGVDDARAALLLRDNVSHRHDIERAYLKAIGEARSEVLIVNAYFVPGRKLRKALLKARERGVRVRLLLQGRYEHFMQYRAARPVLKRLVNAGMEVCEYSPSALHAKVAVVDERWATVGSTNLDPLSLLLAREANVTTTDRRFAALLREQLDHIVCHRSEQMNAQALNNRPWHQRILDRIAFGIMRTLLFVTGHRY